MSKPITVTITLPAAQIATLAQSVAMGHYASLDDAISSAIASSQTAQAASIAETAKSILANALPTKGPVTLKDESPAPKSENDQFFDEWEAELLAMHSGLKGPTKTT